MNRRANGDHRLALRTRHGAREKWIPCAAFRQAGVEIAELTSQIIIIIKKKKKKKKKGKEELSAFGVCLCHPLRTAKLGLTQPAESKGAHIADGRRGQTD